MPLLRYICSSFSRETDACLSELGVGTQTKWNNPCTRRCLGHMSCFWRSELIVPFMLDCEKKNFLFLKAFLLGHCWLRFHVQPKATFNPNILATRKLEQFLIPKPGPNMYTKTQHDWPIELKWITYHVPTNTHSSQGESSAVQSLKTMKPWSKWESKDEVPQWDMCRDLDRVALDWLLDRINLEPKIQIKYVDTKNQLVDSLTKGSFSWDEWSHLLFYEFSDIFWQPYQKFSLSRWRAHCDWYHVETRTRHNIDWWLSGGESQTHQSCDARSVQRGCLATKIGISGQSGDWQRKKNCWLSFRKLGTFRLKLRSWKFPSEPSRQG